MSSSILSDLKLKGTSAAEVSSESSGTVPRKRKSGRPKRGDVPEINRDVAKQVSYVTMEVKTTVKRIQAARLLETGVHATESDIIREALLLYVKQNKLDINRL